MKLKIEVNSTALDTEYGGEQEIPCEIGEYQLKEIFRLPFFRIVIDEVIDNALCFRLMEGGIAHYFVLEGEEDSCTFHRTTSLGEDNFYFKVVEE